MITIQIEDAAVRLKLDEMPEAIRGTLRRQIGYAAEKLRTHIARNKLRGQVLNRVTGALGDTLNQKVEETPTGIEGIVSTGKEVHYAAIHEYGGVFSRLMTQAWGNPVKNPRDVTYRYPERSYMRTGLADVKEEIVTRLRNAVTKASAI